MKTRDDTETLLRDSVRRALERTAAPHAASGSSAGSAGRSNNRWAVLAELGLLGLGIGDEFGGSGRADAETLAVAGELGRVAAAEPFVEAIVLAAAAIDRLGTRPQKHRWLPGVAAGEVMPVWAHLEPGWRHPYELPSLAAARNGDDWTLTGHKTAVATGGDVVVVSARLDDSAETALFVLDAKRPELRWQAAKTYDGRDEASLVLDRVRVTPAERLGSGAVQAALERLLGDASLCAAAETVGAMEAMLELTVQHLRTREQFGSKLASFQVLQHRVADMSVALEEARSMLMYAARAWQTASVEGPLALSALKVHVGNASRFVGEQAVQLHGGLGLAMEYALAPLFLRTTMAASRFGDVEHHLARLIVAGGLYSRAT